VASLKKAIPVGGGTRPAASPLDALSIVLGAELVAWFLLWLASSLAGGRPLLSSPPAGIQNVVAFLGSGVTATVAGSTSLLVWFFRRTALPLTSYLTWVSGVSVASVLIVVGVSHALPPPVAVVPDDSDTLFQDGEASMANSNWKQADFYFSQVKPDSPHYFRAIMRRGRAELFMQDYAAAETHYRQALEMAKARSDKNEELDARYSIARVRFAVDDAKYASQEFAELLKEPRFHDSPEVMLNLASADFDIGNFKEAEALIGRFPFNVKPFGLDPRDIWGVAYFLRAKLAARSSTPDCVAIRKDVAAAQELVADVMSKMDPQESLTSCLKSDS